MSLHFLRTLQILLIVGFTAAACSSGESGPSILRETTVDGHSVTEIKIDAIPDKATEIGLSEF